MIPKMNSLVENIPEAMSIFVNQIVYDKKSKGERVYTFSLGEAFFDIPRFEINDKAFAAGYHYSSSLGQPKLRACISDLYKKRYDTYANPENEILISCGSKAIIFMLFKTVLSEGDEVLIHEPAWLSYKEQIKLAGGICKSIPYHVDIAQWGAYLTKKTKVIVVNNPNNPSGRVYSREELTFLLELAKKYDLFILSDEAYSDFLTPEDSFISFAGVDRDKEHCLVVNSLSKNMGMSGWRVGYTISHKDIIKQLLKLNQHIITCAPTVLQDYMADNFESILNNTLPQAVKMAEKRKQVQKLMDDMGIEYLTGVGTFYFLIDVSPFCGNTEELVYDLLINHNIATVPGRAYGESTKDFLRFSIGVEPLNDIEYALKRIREFLDVKSYDSSKIRALMKEYGII